MMLALGLIWATVFEPPGGGGSIRAYANTAQVCSKELEQVTYTVHTNGTDKKFLTSCVLTYDHIRCKSPLVGGAGCPSKETTRLVTNKIVMVARHVPETCLEKSRELAGKLKDKSFSCYETGIN